MTELHEDVVTLLDEEGQEHQFVVLDILMVDDREYAILIPAEDGMANQDAGEQEAVIFRIVENEDEQTLMVVEDDDEWDAVARAWEEQMELEDEEDEEM